MTDYASLKVPDLKALLSERNLPQTGNKAALIARLEENDASAAAEPAPAAPAGKFPILCSLPICNAYPDHEM